MKEQDNTENGMNKAITLLQMIVELEKKDICAFEVLSSAMNEETKA